MLKISEMAKLANTTRRTLIFYDEQDVFHPIERSSSGYRYYKYEQLYELLFILSMKDMGLSLNQIKEIQNDSSSKIIDELINIQ
ncbi:MerR family transcriptional regulator, partial [Lactobacillus salivarius]|nr:MerR family transcriptional regulator [Ligilactobacillus salivarius]